MAFLKTEAGTPKQTTLSYKNINFEIYVYFHFWLQLNNESQILPIKTLIINFTFFPL